MTASNQNNHDISGVGSRITPVTLRFDSKWRSSTSIGLPMGSSLPKNRSAIHSVITIPLGSR